MPLPSPHGAHGAPRPQLLGRWLLQPRLLPREPPANDVRGDHGLPPRAPRGRVVGHGGGCGGSRSTNTRVGQSWKLWGSHGYLRRQGASCGGSMVHRGGSFIVGHTFEPLEQLGAFEDEEEYGYEAHF
ncbi:hypothetical protein GUJ93_ZPchr0011g27495 [Zizania palustris]|uniref:Uncharacterized protein n=1 Tax=Zizania palustris TaxID=103762 RepID=A0A8J5WG05_ZIZPA|nr:hypothetical protein GUJ93_ZPchr0011g27495 [Zizania palustris]